MSVATQVKRAREQYLLAHGKEREEARKRTTLDNYRKGLRDVYRGTVDYGNGVIDSTITDLVDAIVKNLESYKDSVTIPDTKELREKIYDILRPRLISLYGGDKTLVDEFARSTFVDLEEEFKKESLDMDKIETIVRTGIIVYNSTFETHKEETSYDPQKNPQLATAIKQTTDDIMKRIRYLNLYKDLNTDFSKSEEKLRVVVEVFVSYRLSEFTATMNEYYHGTVKQNMDALTTEILKYFDGMQMTEQQQVQSSGEESYGGVSR